MCMLEDSDETSRKKRSTPHPLDWNKQLAELAVS